MSKILLVENNFITESKQVDKSWYIEGIFAQAEALNKNGRVYPEKILDRAMNDFNENFIKTNRAAGELNHPTNAQINPDRVAIKIESIEKNGYDYIGRAKVLSTDCGKTIQAMLEGGLVIGVSTRGTGTVQTLRDGVGTKLVNDDFSIVTIDAVMNPSAPKALVDSIFEDTQFESLLSQELLFEQFIEFLNTKQMVKKIPTKAERELAMVESVNNLIKKLTK